MESLSQYEIPYFYVLDEFSSGLNVQCTVTSKMRNEATQNLKKTLFGYSKWPN